MLDQARANARASGLSQVRFELADAEDLRVPNALFDHVFRCAALALMRDVPRA
ncbi:MAG: class I SAM-dependent methyltransferase [Thiobacillaceae bacterium]